MADDQYFKRLDEEDYNNPIEDLIIFNQESILLDELIALLKNAAEQVPHRSKIKFFINTETSKAYITARIKLGELT